MLGDPSFIGKLWNKGVDIAASIVASTISALIIALIATLTWKFKRGRDLRLEADKQRQQSRIAQELEREKRRADHRDFVRRLAAERDSFASAISAATDLGRLQEEWVRYLRWLTENRLNNIPHNQKILNACAHVGRMSGPPNVVLSSTQLKLIAEQVRDTELPPLELQG
jgi:hypothetical protein